MHRVTLKIKQSVLTLVSLVSSSGTADNKFIRITSTMIVYKDMKSTEHALLHPICVLSHLMCVCIHCNKKLYLYYWTHWSCWWIYHFKTHRFNAIFHKDTQSTKKRQIWVEKPRSGSPARSHAKKRLLP